MGRRRLERARFGRARSGSFRHGRGGSGTVRLGRPRGSRSVVNLLEVCRDIRNGELQFRLVGVGRWRTGWVSQADMAINVDGYPGVSS